MLRALVAIAVAAMLVSSAELRAQDETTSPQTSKKAGKKDDEGKKKARKARKDGSTTGSAAKKENKEVGNTVCPVSGHAVGSMEADSHIVYNGQKIGLCCSSCEKKFMENPEEYLRKAQENAKQPKG